MAIPKKVTFKFSKDQDYRRIPVNGAWGGPTPRGDVWVEFFHESQETPPKTSRKLTDDGVISEEKAGATVENKNYTRTLFVGMMLRPEHAESIGNWLQEKARQARDQEARAQEEAENEPTH